MPTQMTTEATIELQLKKLFPDLFREAINDLDFFGEFKFYMEKYLANYVKIKFQSEELITDTKVWNENEKFQFKVYVYNNGPIDMKDIKLEIQGTAYADVSFDKNDDDLFQGFIIKNIGVLDAGEAKQISGLVYGKCTTHTNDKERPLVKGRIIGWNASLVHLITDSTKMGPINSGVTHIVKQN